MDNSSFDPRRPNTQVTLQLSGLHCTNCALSIERHLIKLGVQNPRVEYATGKASFSVASSESVSSIVHSIQNLGYDACVEGDLTVSSDRSVSIIIKLCISGILTLPLLLAMFFSDGLLHNPWLQWIIATPVFMIGILHFGSSGIRSVRAGVANMDVLIALGILGGYVASVITLFLGLSHETIFFEATCSITTFVMLGHYLEERAVKKTTTAIESLSKIQPSTARRLMKQGDEPVVIAAEAIAVGDLLQINDGDTIPTDGKLIEGSLSCDESIITGESVPVEHEVGEHILGGTVVVGGSGIIEATAIGVDTALGSIIRLVEEALHKKPNIQRIGDAVSSIFVPAVLIISIIVLTTSLLFFEVTVADAIVRALAITVVACPCAMGLATPTAIMVALGKAARSGILIRGGDTLERMAKIRCVAFDKTGTLTSGRFSVSDLTTNSSFSSTEIQGILRALLQSSSHPIARSLTEAFRTCQAPLQFTEIKETKGLGVSARGSDGSTYYVGGRQLVRLQKLDSSRDLVLIRDTVIIASLDIIDSLRPEARQAVESLLRANYDLTIISGDSHKKTAGVAKDLSITSFHAEQMPSDKLAVLEGIQKTTPVAFVGDGINDAPTLAQATIGISLSSGSDVARHSAQVILSDNSLLSLPGALKLSRITVRVIKQNLAWAFLYNIIAIPLAASGFITPLAGALLMSFSDIVIVANSLRIKSYKI
jgi:P-type Cu+ transporter